MIVHECEVNCFCSRQQFHNNDNNSVRNPPLSITVPVQPSLFLLHRFKNVTNVLRRLLLRGARQKASSFRILLCIYIYWYTVSHLLFPTLSSKIILLYDQQTLLARSKPKSPPSTSSLLLLTRHAIFENSGTYWKNKQKGIRVHAHTQHTHTQRCYDDDSDSDNGYHTMIHCPI